MPIVRYGSGVVSASGSVSGNVLSRNASGAYSRVRTKPKQNYSNDQVKSRSCQSQVALAWSNVLSEEHRNLWRSFAASFPVINVLGDISRLTGQQSFIQANLARCFCVLPLILSPPLSFSRAEQDPSISVVLSL